MHVLITGGCGFVGARTVAHLHEKHPQWLITVLDLELPLSEKRHSSAEYIKADITSLSSVREALLKVRPQAVIHTAGISPPLTDRYFRRIEKLVRSINIDGTLNVLEASQEAGVEAFVFTSSCCAVIDDYSGPDFPNIDERWPTVEYGKGTIYGESKAEAEISVLRANKIAKAASETSFKTCCLRPATTFGEGDYQLVPNIVELIRGRLESPWRLGDGMNMWDIVYVGNSADAHVLAVENLLSEKPTAAGEAFFIQNEGPLSARDFMLFIWKEFNGHIPPFQIQIPVSVAWFIGGVAEFCSWIVGRSPGISRASIWDATAMRYASGEKARRILGYVPRVGLEEGLSRSVKHHAARLKNEEKWLRSVK